MGIVLTKTDDHASIVEVPNKTIKELAGIKLVGKGAGDIVKTNNENLLKILQNFAGDTPPEDPMPGQLWYDTSEQILKLFHGNGWIELTQVKRRDEFKLKKKEQPLTPSFDIVNNSFEITRNGLKLSTLEYDQDGNTIIIPNSKRSDIIIISN
jgi:hypothetical protein